MKSINLPVVLLSLVAPIVSPLAIAREWSSPTGAFQVEGDLVAFDDEMVVIKKTTGDLIALELEQLCEADQDYVKSKEVVDAQKKSAEEMQTWTAKDGMKVRGQVVSYGQRDLVVQRRLGKVEIDGKPFGEIDELHQKLLLKILSHLEKKTFEDQKALEEWARKELRGQPKKYELSGVLMRLESGDLVGIPFFLFSPEELGILQPGWELWLAKKESDDTRNREDFLMRSAAMAYQRDRAAKQQIEMVKLDLLGAATGAVNVWQVGLAPRPGVRARPFSVMVTAQNSAQARQLAVRKYPQYVVRGVRKASY